MSIRLNEDQHSVLSPLLSNADGAAIEDLVAATGRDQSVVMAVLTEAESRKWVEIATRTRDQIVPGARAAEAVEGRLPERLVLAAIVEPGRLAMQGLVAIARERGLEVSEIVKWGGARGWFGRDKGDLVASPEAKAALEARDADERALELATRSEGPVYVDDLAASGIDAARAEKLLRSRPDVAKLKPRNLRRARLTDEGRKALAKVEVVKVKNQLTGEEIHSGKWREIQLRAYDVTLPAETVRPAKLHPMNRIIQETRQAFLTLGFTEIVSPLVESAFWDFDALFQPQDHPARDMQDTFYLDRPAKASLPDAALVERVRRTHEDGGGTGSSGWGYRWNPAEAARTVLRTHTTATTIRALAEDPNPPRKIFCVGRVFRNETISYKHLPEFTQVDGVIVDERASFRALLGTLAEFYKQMGFDRLKFKPSFFPYTEPSAEVFVWFEPKKTWIELGGSGVFRPEVTEPLGCKVPVLAWGLGLERLAMLRYGLADIRGLYFSDLDWVGEAPLCR